MERSRGTAPEESPPGGDGFKKGQREQQRSHTRVCVGVFDDIRVDKEQAEPKKS